MWTILKFEKKNLSFLKKDLEKKLGSNCKIYKPKLIYKRYKNNKLVKKEFNFLGDYLFCFNEKFSDDKYIKIINYVKGIKYVLEGFKQSQKEISEFINKCHTAEDSDGYITEQFYDLRMNTNYKFYSGPFTNSIFKIIQLQKNKIGIMMGDLKTTINKKKYLFQPV